MAVMTSRENPPVDHSFVFMLMTPTALVLKHFFFKFALRSEVTKALALKQENI